MIFKTNFWHNCEKVSPSCSPLTCCSFRSALQILHKACEVSRRYNYFPGGMALTWMGYYESCIGSEQSCINEWNAMQDLETLRPDSPAVFVNKWVQALKAQSPWPTSRFTLNRFVFLKVSFFFLLLLFCDQPRAEVRYICCHNLI